MARRWWYLAALTLARAAMGFQFQSVAALAPLVAGTLGLDKTHLGWLIGLYLLPGVVFALPGGLLGARFGDKRVVLVGLTLMALGGTWLSLSESFAEAGVARLVSGIGAVMLNVLLTKMVADWFDGKERLLAMSVLINSWPIGIGLALLLAGPLAGFFGWRWAIESAGVFAATGFVVVMKGYRAPAAVSPGMLPTAGIGILTREEWKLLGFAALPWLLYNAAYQIMISFLPSYFVEIGLGISQAGSLVALNTVLFVISVQVGGVLLKKARRPDLVCHAMMGGWCISLLVLASAATPLPWLIVGGALGGVPAAAFVSLPAEFLRPQSRGAGMGVFYTIYYLGCAVLPGVAGWLYDLSGSGRAPLWMAAALATATIPTVWLFRKAMPVAHSAVAKPLS